MVSSGIVLLRVFLRRGIESPEQLEELGINVYASIPVSETFTANVIQGKTQKIRKIMKAKDSWQLKILQISQ